MLLADNEEINRWLGEHPLALGGIFLVLGLVLLGFGVKDVVSGKARTKWGNQVEGGTAALYGTIRIVGGAGAIVFAVYKLIEGLLSR